MAASTLCMTACDDDEVVSTEPAITAHAGNDQTVAVGEEVNLNGSQTNVTAIDQVEYLWSFLEMPSNSTAQLSNASALSATFIPDQPGEYVIELRVSGDGIEDTDAVVITAEGEAAEGPVLVENNINADETWTKQTPDGQPDYILAAGIDVNAHLRIEPGVIILVQEGFYLQVSSSGKLSAEGSAEEHIVFTGTEETPGFWSGIYFNNTTARDNKLLYTEVLYGGRETNVGAFNVGINGEVEIANCLIAHSQNEGIHLLGGSFHAFSENQFEANQGSAIQLPANAVGGIQGNNTFEDNGHDGVEISSGNVDQAASWPGLGDGRYLLSSSINVDATLSIEPGAHFLMEENTRFVVGSNGVLSAIGTVADSIIFEGARQQKGYWHGMGFDNTRSVDNELQYVRISHGGGAEMLRGTGNLVVGARSSTLHSEISISHSLFRDSEAYGVIVSTSGAQLHEFEGNVFKNNEGPAMLVHVPQVQQVSGQNNFVGNNGRDGLEVAGGLTARGGTWQKLDHEAAYFFKDNVTIDHPISIEAGSLLRFGENVSLTIRGNRSNEGSLTAKGTAREMIRFLPEREDVQQPYWDGIYFFLSDAIDNQLEYVEVAYAGRNEFTGGIAANIFVGGSTAVNSRASVSNSLIRNSGGYGAANHGATRHILELENNTFENNALGDVNEH